MKGEAYCQNFINQDLTFLQPSVIHAPQSKQKKPVPEKNTIEIAPLDIPENNSPQEQEKNLPQTLALEVVYDRSQSSHAAAPVQQVEPVVGLTPEEQQKKEEDADLMLINLLGLTPCEDDITTPLQTLDGIYVNQPSRFLPLAQESKKLREEEESSQ